MDDQELDKILQEVQKLHNSNRYDEGIALLEPFVEQFPKEKRIRNALSLIYGSKAELLLDQTDKTGFMPSLDEVVRIEKLLSRACELDPELPDIYWNRAVVEARFRGNFDQAKDQLDQAKKLGYIHPMMSRLEELIYQREPVSSLNNADDLEKLLKKLIEQASGPNIDLLFSKSGLGEFYTLQEYCDKGVDIINTGKISRESFLKAYSIARLQMGDTKEITLDFLRRISPYMNDEELQGIVGNAHMKVIAEMALFFGATKQADDRMLRKARRYAQLGLDIAKEASFPVDNNTMGDLLIALGQSYSRIKKQNLQQAIPLFLDAYGYKEKAYNDKDVIRLRDLLKSMIEYQIDQSFISYQIGIGGIGENLETIKVTYDAANRLNDDNLIFRTGLTLAEAMGGASQPDEAIKILQEISEKEGMSPDQEFSIQFVLAARLSETQRPEAIQQAREISEKQVKYLEKFDIYEKPSTVWMNLGNYRRLDGDLNGAREAFRQALKLNPTPKPNELPLQRGQLKMLLAEVEFMLGNEKEGRKLLMEAEKDLERLDGVGKLHFESMAAKWLFVLGDVESSISHAIKGIRTRQFILSQGPAPDVWESMLREWTRLDVSAVRSYHKLGTPDALEKALLISEGAKGRLFAWLSRVKFGKEAAKYALDDNRQEEALVGVKEWVRSGSRWMVSLFAHREGLSIVGVGPGGLTKGAYFEGFDYDDLRLRVFEPWETGLQAGLVKGDPIARGLAGSITELLLSRIGSWFERAIPELSQGGNELVILPHRLFRSLPLAHVELTSGKRLTQVFERVFICPTLFEFAQSLNHKENLSSSSTEQALVDADGTLPFAYLEGLASMESSNIKARDSLTMNTLSTALTKPGTLLLSCHGDFDERNPWQSTINAADGNIILGHLLEDENKVATELLILGVCEAGKSRRSISDEPLSFPTFLQHLGASLVIAPAWQVEDFSSFLFITKLIREMRSGVHPSTALASAADYLRKMSASGALKELSNIKDSLDKNSRSLDAEVTNILLQRLQDYNRWLSNDFEHNEYPFDAIDWAGYQLFGYNYFKK